MTCSCKGAPIRLPSGGVVELRPYTTHYVVSRTKMIVECNDCGASEEREIEPGTPEDAIAEFLHGTRLRIQRDEGP